MSREHLKDADREEVARFIEKHWRSPVVMSHGRAFYPHLEEGIIERRGGEIVGLITYHVEDGAMEILTLNSTLEGSGIGSSLVITAIETARHNGCRRVWFTTTNDNLKSISFNQRLGFRMVAIHVGVVDEARRIKPQIPQFGERGVRIQDEIVMELGVEPFIEDGMDV